MKAAELFDLTGKVAVVTGGAGGIGVVYGRALCEAGAAVVLADLNVEAARREAAKLVADGGQAIGVALDVTDPESAAAMAEAATEAFGGIDILVNNAAIMTDLPPYSLTTMPMPDFDRVMDVNLKGPLICTQAVVPSMIGRGGGRIVNGLSAGAFMPGGIYALSKLALHGLTANLAAELGRRNINVNAVAPGLVENDSGFAALSKDSPLRAALAQSIPGKKSAPPDDLVGTLLLLCSKAGEWINAQTILVDGGWIMRL